MNDGAAPFSAPLPPADPDAPGALPDTTGLRRLLRVALPDKGPSKAAGWWGPMDFLLTRSHVDEDGDAYHDGLFVSLWKQWDFWLALPETAPPAATHWAQRAWARLRAPHPTPSGEHGLLVHWRSYGADGRPTHWRPLHEDGGAADPAARQALAEAWAQLLHYWQAAEQERRSGWPTRTRLHATLGPAQVLELAALPLFTEHYNDWSDPERSGLWLGDTWVGVRQPGFRGGRRHAAALKLGWRNGTEGPGDPPDDAHAAYQLDVLGEGAGPAPGTAHPPGLVLSYSARQSAPRAPLPGHAARHMEHLLQRFCQAQERLRAAQARLDQQREQQLADLRPGHVVERPPALAQPLPWAAEATDEAVFGPGPMELSRLWQAAARQYATAMRRHWGESGRGGTLPRDARSAHAAAVLQLARELNASGDPGALERFHHRFAFAPAVFARHAQAHGCELRALHWAADGRLLAWTRGRGGAAACWALRPGSGAAGLERLGNATVEELQGATRATHVTLHGLAVQADAEGTGLEALSDAGQVLWQHLLGGTVRCMATAPGDADRLAVGTSNGYLVLLRKAAGPDPLHAATSRLHELRRVLFWEGEARPLLW